MCVDNHNPQMKMSIIPEFNERFGKSYTDLDEIVNHVKMAYVRQTSEPTHFLLEKGRFMVYIPPNQRLIQQRMLWLLRMIASTFKLQ